MLSRSTKVPERHTTFFEIWDALKERGCPICRMKRSLERKSLEDILGEYLMEPETRERMYDSMGWCPAHTRQASGMHKAFETSLLYHALCTETIKQLNQGKLPVRSTECPICLDAIRAESRWLTDFQWRCVDRDFQEHYLNSDGLCFAHLHQILQLKHLGKGREWLVNTERDQYVKIQEGLKKFIDHHDHQEKRRMGSEGDVWLRTLEKFSGTDIEKEL